MDAFGLSGSSSRECFMEEVDEGEKVNRARTHLRRIRMILANLGHNWSKVEWIYSSLVMFCLAMMLGGDC